MNDRRSRVTAGVVLAALTFAAVRSTSQASPPQSYAGTYALQGGSPRMTMRLVATPGRSPLDASLDVWATAKGSGRVVDDYDVEQTKKLHLIVVSDDFVTFMHLHPSLSSDGHFRIDVHVPQPALYHVYADSTPRGLGQQVFRFDIPFAGGRPTPVMISVPKSTSQVGPYVVTLTPATLRVGATTVLSARVTKDGKPARDLREYLGASAHAVFLHYGDLTYVHAHPVASGSMPMGSMKMEGAETALAPNAAVPPQMVLHVGVREPGFYRLWLEFSGGGKLRVATFWLRANDIGARQP
jgi:hypothetical protein